MQEAFFVRSASPGAVLRFLERLARRDEPLPAELLISDAVGPWQWRALPVAGLASVAPRLALAFSSDVFHLQEMPAGWSWTRYESAGAAEYGALAKKRLWERSSPVERWASVHGLPLTRLTRPPKVIDYETVAQLDQRSLLLEDMPRLYRFPLQAIQ
ncbi:MAG: hypothetical protein NTX57_12805 [Armatimonadetes bacterium]|nr:hypothetical protein [Armatimonadota bacterium]